ncbi:cysteine protease StiP family protein [Nocardioides sp. Kera G14]|uniref:cysteine protease StiP family protein n=1 Tax=Nocardioides sp. Kera G14 TaxID=2884264 RepID=UPI001D0FA255|nr:cysteine protease StiP family protein [Nocardioides sp. Kera G14]UDY23234.1 cysteine protease StiP family protein [Nocardioides sp. Kera G14]
MSQEPLRGPSFGSYRSDEVGWLLKDLSDVALEAPTEEREEAIQSGRGHYAESLPIEFTPDAAYRALFEESLHQAARRVAVCAAVVTELVLEARGSTAVLVSLARAGVPVGILMRRWAAHRHGYLAPHYAMSIVRGRGIDRVALEWLAAHHDPVDVMFIDGWTGKGMITRELADAVAAANSALGTCFSDQMAVLADTGHCVDIFGTRDDFLIPSACLNSTVSGLVSRTVLNADHLGPGEFHGAKFYASLAPDDVSGLFLDAVSAHFPSIDAEVDTQVALLRSADRSRTWSGRAIVKQIGSAYGIGEENLIKPGVGETTRVLLRRVPWRVLVREGSLPEVPHIVRLAEARGVPIEEVPGLGYTTVGLIRPRELA